MKIFLIAIAVVIVLGVGGIFLAGPALSSGMSFVKSKPKGTEVRTQFAEIGSLTETVAAPGEIEPHTHVAVSARVSAKILQLPFREGDEVKEGDIICKLDDRDLKADYTRAEARRDGEKFSLRSAEANLTGQISNLEFARKELDRRQKLFETGDESRSNLDAAMERVRNLEANVEATRHQISVAESSLAAAEADIDRAQEALDQTVIEATMDGVITQLNVEVGEQVLGTLSNIGTHLMTIADLDRMIFNAQIAESDIAKVAEGQQAQIFINAYPDEIFGGTVRQIALQRSGLPDGTGYFKTEVEIDLQGRRIYSGLVANVEIEITKHEGLVLESQAIVDRELESIPESIKRDNPLVDHSKRTVGVVYRVIDGKAICTPVKAGPSDTTHRIVLEGISEGEEVVIGPYKVLAEDLKHDTAVVVNDDAMDKEDESGSGASVTVE